MMQNQSNNDTLQKQALGSTPPYNDQKNLESQRRQVLSRGPLPRAASTNNQVSSSAIKPAANNPAGRCFKADCDRPVYKNDICKHHFCIAVRSSLKKELRNLYRGPEKAYASMDFYGRGYITEEDFLRSIVMKRIPFSVQDVKEFFKVFNLFSVNISVKHIYEKIAVDGTPNPEAPVETKGQAPKAVSQESTIPCLTLDIFKTTFFPQLYLINEDDESDNDKQVRRNKEDLKQNHERQTEIITLRLKRLEKILKDKFQNNWESVRKAFLALDSDYDGYITVEDILRHFGQEKGVVYNDLKKLIMDKDSKKQGKIGYTDFSKWVGNTIHLSEGFYFRHDSIKNPQFEANLQRNEDTRVDYSRKLAQESLINQNLEKTVLDKIKFQWKTLRKAFMDLNMEKSGSILPEELKFYFEHWGLKLTDAQFKYLFDKFDSDKDGKISYKDFQLTVGSEIHPAEGLYFRQDKPSQVKIEACKHEKCWQQVQGQNHYCLLHQKVHQDECLKLFNRFFKQINTKWAKFIAALKAAADPSDTSQIVFQSFLEVLERFKVEPALSEQEKQHLLDSFPGRDEGPVKKVNISRLYDQKYNMMLQSLYRKVDIHDNDGEDDPIDQSGYTGQFYRPQQPLVPMSESELVEVINRKNKLIQIIRTIKEIDKQRNGFITTTELDDILKLNYKEELRGRDLRGIMKKYVSIQNRVLLDYKAFRDSIIEQLKRLNETYTYAGTESSLSPQKTTLQTTIGMGDSSLKKQQQQKRGVYEALNKFIAQRIEGSKEATGNDASFLYNSVSNKLKMSSRNSNREGLLAARSQGATLRPKTRDPFVNGHRQRNLLNPEGGGLLNKTLNYNSNAVLDIAAVDSSNPNQLEYTVPAKKFGLKKMSTLEHYRARKAQMGQLLDDQEQEAQADLARGINIEMRRAQSSHGQFGVHPRGTMVPGNSSTMHLRKQRRHIQTSHGMYGSDLQGSLEQDNQANTLQDLRVSLSVNPSKPKFPASGQAPPAEAYRDQSLPKTINAIDELRGQSMMYQTVATSSSQQNVTLMKFKQVLKSKLQYEWKNIYRLLSVQDKQSNGTVSLADLEQAIHQCGAFLSKEDLKKLASLYSIQGENGGTINYQKLSQDLGLHQKSFTFLKSQQIRQQNIDRLRSLYSSTEKKKPFLNMSLSTAPISRANGSEFNTGGQNTAKEKCEVSQVLPISGGNSKEEVKSILFKKIKQFKDLIGIYQRKNHLEQPIIPMGEFKTVLKGLGINIPNAALQKFIVTKDYADLGGTLGQGASSSKRRTKSSQSRSFYSNAGVDGIGVDAREFLKFYI